MLCHSIHTGIVNITVYTKYQALCNTLSLWPHSHFDLWYQAIIVFCTPTGISGYIISNTITIEEALYNPNEGCLRKCFEIFQITVEKSTQCQWHIQCILSWRSPWSGLQKVKKHKNNKQPSWLLNYRLMHIGLSNWLTFEDLTEKPVTKDCILFSTISLDVSNLYLA